MIMAICYNAVGDDIVKSLVCLGGYITGLLIAVLSMNNTSKSASSLPALVKAPVCTNLFQLLTGPSRF